MRPAPFVDETLGVPVLGRVWVPFRRVFSLVAAVLLGALALVVVALPADAHTPSFQVSCDKLAVNLQNYKVDTSSAGAKANQVIVTVGGVVVAAEKFGKSYAKTFDLPVHDGLLPVQTRVIAWDAPDNQQWSPTWNGVAKPCDAPAVPVDLGFTKQLGCDAAIVNFTSVGRQVKAVVTRNGEQVWSGLVGQNGAAANTGRLAAKAGDKFGLAYLDGDKLKSVGEFTFAQPESCAPVGIPANLDVTKLVDCEGVTFTLQNAGHAVKAVVVKNGKVVWTKALEAGNAKVVTDKLPAKAGDWFAVAYLSGHDKSLVEHFVYKVPSVCGSLPTPVPSVPGLDLLKNISCEGVVLTLTNAGAPVKAIVEQNGKQVWDGMVGGKLSSVDTGQLPAKVGDVFVVKHLKGEGAEAVELGKFTYALPTTCLPVQVPDVPQVPAVDLGFTKGVSCEGVLVNLTNAGGLVKALVSRNGEQVWSGTVGGDLTKLGTGLLPAKAGDVFKVSYLNLTDKLPIAVGEEFVYNPPSLCSATKLVFDKQLGCDFAQLALKNAGAPVKAVVTQNGKEVWSGLVGGATPALVTDKLPAVPGDVFVVKYLQGDKLEQLGEFTHQVPDACTVPEALPVAQFTDTCEGVTALLGNTGGLLSKLVVQTRASAEDAWVNVGEPVSLPGKSEETVKRLVPTTVDGTQVRTVLEGTDLPVGQLHTWRKPGDCTAGVPAPGVKGIEVARDCNSLTVTLANTVADAKDKLVFVVEHTAEAAKEYTLLPGDTATYTTPLKAGESILVKLGDQVQKLDLTPAADCPAAVPAPVPAVPAAPAPGVEGVTAHDGGLPVTGSSLSTLLGVAGGLLAMGAFLALVARRKSLGVHAA